MVYFTCPRKIFNANRLRTCLAIRRPPRSVEHNDKVSTTACSPSPQRWNANPKNPIKPKTRTRETVLGCGVRRAALHAKRCTQTPTPTPSSQANRSGSPVLTHTPGPWWELQPHQPHQWHPKGRSLCHPTSPTPTKVNGFPPDPPKRVTIEPFSDIGSRLQVCRENPRSRFQACHENLRSRLQARHETFRPFLLVWT